MLSSDSIANALWLVVGVATFVFIMRVKGEQLREKDARIADKDKYIVTLLEKITLLEKRIDNKDDKAEVMFGEIAELNKAVGLNQGIFARPEADARQEKTIEDIHKAPSPYDEPAPAKKRGRHAQ